MITYVDGDLLGNFVAFPIVVAEFNDDLQLGEFLANEFRRWFRAFVSEIVIQNTQKRQCPQTFYILPRIWSTRVDIK